MDKQCSSCGGFCGEVCEREDVVEPYNGWVLRNVYFENGEPLMHSEPEIDEQCPSEPIGEIVEAHGLIAVSIPEMPPVGTKLYAQPLLNQTCCGCGASGGYALYCGWCWEKGTYK